VEDSEARVYVGIDRSGFERMKNDLRGLGVEVPDGDSCVLDHSGVSGSLDYSESERRVEIRITRTPFFVSSANVTSILDRVMERYSEAESDARDKSA